MAFNNIGDFWLAAGATMSVYIIHGGGVNVGAQYLAAQPLGPADHDISFITTNQKWVYHEYDPYNGYTYEADVHNSSSKGASFNLCGGGFS